MQASKNSPLSMHALFSDPQPSWICDWMHAYAERVVQWIATPNAPDPPADPPAAAVLCVRAGAVTPWIPSTVEPDAKMRHGNNHHIGRYLLLLLLLLNWSLAGRALTVRTHVHVRQETKNGRHSSGCH